MKLAKSLLLASATAFVSFAATAADLPRKSAPAAACNFGAGFFQVPGSATCLQIGGLVRTEWFVGNGSAVLGDGSSPVYGGNQYGSGARLFLHADARTNTGLGVVRSYGRFLGTNGISHPYGSTLGANSVGANGNVSVLEAFIQFAGVTAGYAQSNFNFYNNDWNYGGSANIAGAHDVRTNLLSYTAALGSGLTATVGIEEGLTRRNGAGFTGVVAATAPTVVDAAIVNGASRTPDVVANVGMAQAWGRAQVMAALHNNVNNMGGTKWGYAVGAGAFINAFTPGSQFVVQAGYADGATHFVARGANAFPLANGGAAYAPSDVAFADATGGMATTKAWSVLGGYRHVWSSAFTTSLVGGYTSYDLPGAALPTAKLYSVALTNTYTAAPGLTLGLEIFHENGKVAAGTAPLAATAVESVKTTGVGLRVQRVF